jgi:AcrR family transcriptional regulator
MDTKELILETATDLFNQYGTGKISTNQIAKEAGISSGNLYYHYTDKAHIIREIYEQMIQSWETPYDRIENRSIFFDSLKRFIEDNFELLWKYRFFYRETIALLQSDPVLAARHGEITNQRVKRQHEILIKAEKDGIIQFPDEEKQSDDLLTILWIIANYYLEYLESMNLKVEYQDFENGAELVLKVLRKYLK